MRLIVDLQHMLHRELRIALRGGKSLVTEQFLDGTQVGAFFEQVSAEGMTKGVGVEIGWKSPGDGDLLHDPSHTAGGEAGAAQVQQQCRGGLPFRCQQRLAFGHIVADGFGGSLAERNKAGDREVVEDLESQNVEELFGGGVSR